MATRKTTRTTRPRRDVESEITDRIIEALEAGTVPWQKPWTASGVLPTSATTGRPYRGINVWLLSLTAMNQGYSSPYWLTYKQAAERGGNVRKGEKGTMVVFWKLLDVERENVKTGETEQRKLPLMRHYTVFNLDQCDGVVLPPRMQIDTDAEPIDPSDAVDEIVNGYVDGPVIRHAAIDLAAYSPDLDVLNMPNVEMFSTVDGYASTLFHEITHSTGHESRLNRFAKTGAAQHFGSERYAFEELLAQMGSAMLAAHAGTDPQIENSAAYIENWLSVLRGDKSLVIRAAQGAQKAIDRVLGTTFETKTEEETS